MTEISYAGAAVDVRDDLLEAHRRQWQRLAAPGAWWSGPERVAIAAEVRNAAQCLLCRERKAALSPNAASGEHDAIGGLPDAAVEVIHRVTTDPGRLSRTWFEKTLANGLSEERYVELIGVLVTVYSIDSFCRGIGVPPHPLPSPLAGEPSQYRPASAEHEVGWVAMIPAAAANGAEADLWQRGRTGNVIRALSLVPDEVRALKDLSAAHYLSPEEMMDLTRGRTLDRRQIELVAGRVSALRECFY
jgi:alkylhydroperoxidase family enzyme